MNVSPALKSKIIVIVDHEPQAVQNGRHVMIILVQIQVYHWESGENHFPQ